MEAILPALLVVQAATLITQGLHYRLQRRSITRLDNVIDQVADLRESASATRVPTRAAG